MTFVRGHRIEQRAYEFPHLCPGEGCAIAAWLYRRDVEAGYRSLDPEDKDEDADEARL